MINGTVIKGLIRKNQIIKIGPSQDGEFFDVEVIEIQCKKIIILSAEAGQNCTIEIMFLNK